MVKTYSYQNDGKVFLSPHFQVREFASKSGDKLYTDEVLIDEKLIALLEALFERLNCKYIIISSGYRTAEHDKAVGGSGKGYHPKGQAADFRCVGQDGKTISAKTVCCALEDMGTVYGIGYITKSYVHVDTRTASKKWWGDETKKNSPSIWKIVEGCRSWYDYFGIEKEPVVPEEPGIHEEPAVSEGPAVPDDPVCDAEPVLPEASAAPKEPSIPDDSSAVSDVEASEDAPIVTDESIAPEMPSTSEECEKGIFEIILRIVRWIVKLFS